MVAIWNDQVIAEAPKDDVIYIEGNWYFPKNAIKSEFYQPSVTHTTCHWKGEASYYNVTVGDRTNPDAAWFYPEPKPSAIERVKKNFADCVAFWHGVEVKAS